MIRIRLPLPTALPLFEPWPATASSGTAKEETASLSPRRDAATEEKAGRERS